MTLRPASLTELSRLLAECHAARTLVTAVDLAALAGVREHSPEDMTVTVEGGMLLADLQALLAQRGQWLPIDPPHPAHVTVRQLLSENLFGPRRCGFGTIREHLIGLEAILADGRVTHSGGRVVKNVAGYDVMKLFVGARDSLGIITAATFKLRPLPEQEVLLSAHFTSLAAACASVESLLQSSVTPVILDLHNLPHAPAATAPYTVLLGFAGTREEIAWQCNHTRAYQPSTQPSTYQQDLWSGTTAVHTTSILPSNLPTALATITSAPFIARAANGIIHHQAPPPPRQPTTTHSLAQRLKSTFDPHHILPDAPQ